MIVLGLVYRLSRWWPKLRPSVGIIGALARAVAVVAAGVVAGGAVASAVVALVRRRAESSDVATGSEHLGSPAPSAVRSSAVDALAGGGEWPPIVSPGAPPTG